jgi:hypothetical protein
VADVETGIGRCVFRNPATLPGWYPRLQWEPFLQWCAGDLLVFRADHEGWSHLYSVSTVERAIPLLLTPGDYMVEDVVLSSDRKTAFYTANVGDDPNDFDRRHLWRTPIDTAAPEQLVCGASLEFAPSVTGDGNAIIYLSADAQRSPLPTVMPTNSGAARRLVEDQIPVDFPSDQLVTPYPVTITAADGIAVPCQRFERREGANAGLSGRKPALVFVHGGPVRQFLLGWHNMGYYADTYATGQYFAQLGYVVLVVNYRLSLGYGHEFARPVRQSIAIFWQQASICGQTRMSIRRVSASGADPMAAISPPWLWPAIPTFSRQASISAAFTTGQPTIKSWLRRCRRASSGRTSRARYASPGSRRPRLPSQPGDRPCC